jgi:hypothetical protein
MIANPRLPRGPLNDFCGTCISFGGSFCNRQSMVRPVSSSTGPLAYNNGRRKVMHHMLHEMLLYLAIVLHLLPLESDYYGKYHAAYCPCGAGVIHELIRLLLFCRITKGGVH